MNKQIHKNLEDTEYILQNINNDDTVEFTQWIKDKANLKYNTQIPKFPIYNNFIYWCNLGVNVGSEQNKLRPVLVVKTSLVSTISTILPLTSKRLNDNFWYHVDLEKIDSTVLVEQIRVVSKIRFANPYRKKGNLVTISQKDWEKINLQLQKLYRLRPLKNEVFYENT